MAISFPTSPSANDTFTVGTKTWIYNGYAWDIQVSSVVPGFNQANAAFDKANSANVLAFNTGIGANAWANSIGTAGNNYTISVGAASNTWANSIIGPSANSWANTKLSNTSGVWFGGNLNISQDLYIGNNITNVTSLIFNTGTNRTPIVAGELTWSQDDDTLHFNSDTPGSAVIHIGQDLVYLVKNQTGSTIYKGNVCMFAGTVGASGRLLIQKAIANNAYPSKYVMGVAATNISNGDDGIVIAQGKVRGIDTSMFSQGDILYLSSTNIGGYSNVMPTAPNNKVTMAAVIYKDSSVGSIMVRPTLGSKLNEDEYVEINGIANGDMLMYVSANGRFENKPQSDINAGRLDGYDTSSSNVANTVVVRDQWGNFAAGNVLVNTANTNFISFTGIADPGQIEGRVWYDATTDHALNYYTDITGVSVAMGRQQVLRVRNATANTYTVGQVVYASGGSVSKVPDIDLAIANDLTKSQVLGVIFGSNIGPNSFGYVMAHGTYVHGDTTAYGVEGTRLYLSPTTAGALQNTMPSAPSHPVQVGVVTYQNAAQGTILISSIQRLTGLNLANGSIGFLVDGTQGRVSDDQANLRYDTGNTTLWVNRVNTGILYVDGINVQPAFAAVNNYTISVGAASNTWANTLSTSDRAIANAAANSSNAYTVTVGAAANNYGNNTFYAKTGGTISGDVVITGNITISGTQTFANTQTLLIGDNILTLNADLPLSVAPTENAGIEVNRGNKSSNAQLIWIETANAWGFTSNSQNAITTYIASNTLVETYAVAGNNYTNQVGAASNTWANNVGTAGNNYTNQVGAAANTWANTLSTTDRAIANSAANSSNAYIITVGAASNTWANTIATAGNNYISSTIYPAINAARVNVSSTAPASPSQGSLWWHKDYGRLFVYYTDEDATSQWVDSTIGIGNPVITDDFVSGNTNNTFYLTFIANTSGTMQTAFVSSGKLTFNSNTGILSATEFNSLSDLNRKTNIAPIQDAIDKITKLDGVTFNWKDNGKPSAGIIAQQLQEVMPELVSSDMSVNYSGIIGLLVECIKELNNKLPK